MTQSTSSAPPRPRAAYLDLFKTILTVGMVYAHVLQLLDKRPGPVESLALIYIDLVTFSGFMLAFGIGTGLSHRARATALSRLRVPLLLFVAYSLSSVAYMHLVAGIGVGSREIADVLLLRHLYGYSEFLASFFLLSLVTSFLRPALFRICDNALAFALCIALCATTSIIKPSPPNYPIIGTLIGSRNYAAFPLVQYLPWFLIGVRYARRSEAIHWTTWLAAVMATLVFGGYVVIFGVFPQRFPPEITWTFGCALPLVINLQFCRAAIGLIRLANWVLVPGRHVLLFVVASNLIIFSARLSLGRRPVEFWQLLAGTAAIVLIVGLLSLVWERMLRWAHSPSGAVNPLDEMYISR